MQYSKPPFGPSSSSSMTSWPVSRQGWLADISSQPHLQRNKVAHVCGERTLEVLGGWVEIDNVDSSAHASAVRVQLLTVGGLPGASQRRRRCAEAAYWRTHLAAAGRADHELRVAAHARGCALRRAARRPQTAAQHSSQTCTSARPGQRRARVGPRQTLAVVGGTEIRRRR